MESLVAPFAPPHCPRTGCRYHTCTEGWRWIHFGSYRRQCVPQVVARFRCCHCGATFSTQTFRNDYWLRRPELLLAIAHRLLACSGYRQVAREARCAPSTVMGLAARLGRQALLLLAQAPRQGPLSEPLVIDGFEGFAYSQYHPLHLHLGVGAQSHYTYALTLSRLRRKGRMRPGQKRRRAAIEARYGRAEPRAIELDMAAAIRIAVPTPQALTIRSDDHPAYPRAFRRLQGYAIGHEGTPSTEARTSDNPLFPVNLMDLQLRHNSANHKRETIAFSKRHQAVLERAALLVAWRNYSKPFSENHGGGTPAMRAGLAEGPLSLERLFTYRRFPGRIALPEPWDRYYRREIDTPGIDHPRRHQLRLAS